MKNTWIKTSDIFCDVDDKYTKRYILYCINAAKDLLLYDGCKQTIDKNGEKTVTVLLTGPKRLMVEYYFRTLKRTDHLLEGIIRLISIALT